MRAQPATQDVPPCVLYFKHPAIKREIQKIQGASPKSEDAFPNPEDAFPNPEDA